MVGGQMKRDSREIQSRRIDAARWKAITTRSATSSSEPFVYAVTTTGIYCRPDCGSRLPLRQNVAFFDSCAAAESAGYRACKRCAPNARPPESRIAAIIEAACRRIDCADEPLSLSELAANAGLSPFHFHRSFRRITGLTPKAYAKARQAQRLRAALPRRTTVTEALYEAGFNSSGRFYSESSGILGMSPSQFQRGAKDEIIRFATGLCSLGSVLAAASARGICAILIGDRPDSLTTELKSLFPHARLMPGDSAFQKTLAKVIRMIEEPEAGRNLPLDIRGTAFQQRVWRALRDIPLGQTATYVEIARKVGAPKASRAVGRACASNILAVAVPCHRVIRGDGNLASYRWGAERKKSLIERERATPLASPMRRTQVSSRIIRNV